MQTKENKRLPRDRNHRYDLDEYNEFVAFAKAIHPDSVVRFNPQSGIWSEYAVIIHEETRTHVMHTTYTCDAHKIVCNLDRKLNRTLVPKYTIDVKVERPQGWRMHLEKSEMDADMLFTVYKVSGLDLETLRQMCQ